MRKLIAFATLAAGVLAAIAVAAPAHATPPPCRTAVTHLDGRPDSGVHGNWAVDTITRTVTICQTGHVAADVKAAAVAPALATYTAVVVDDGAFTTVHGYSPEAGKPLPAGIHGRLHGGFTATFTAQAGFAHYGAVFDGGTYHGTALSTTTNWLVGLWGGSDINLAANLVGWRWVYWTCAARVGDAAEVWVNAEAGDRGDITGCECPKPSPSGGVAGQPSASASASVSAGASASASQAGDLVVVLPADHATASSLPVTGGNVGYLAGGALVLLGAGFGLLYTARRRRDKFEA